MAPMAPSTLPTDRAHTPREANAPKSNTAVAPTLAPEDTPSRNGSARALRTIAWTTVPAVVNAAPTSAASSTRGRRICHTISSATEALGVTGQVVGDHLPHLGTGSTGPTRRAMPSTMTAASTSVQPASTALSGARSRRRPPAAPGGPPGAGPPRSVLPASVSMAVAASSSSIGEPSGYRKPNLGHRTHQPLLRGPVTSVLSQATGLVPPKEA